MYNQAGIPTYSELIMGLPGETYDSFIKGIDTLLEAGQHNSIYIHNCEWLPCAEMGNKEYIKRHGIEYVIIPLNEPHTLIDTTEEIQELSRIIVRTDTMTREDWINLNLYSAVIQSLHHEGLLMLFAIYLHYEKNLSYSDFYKSFIDYSLNKQDSLCNELCNQLLTRFSEVTKGENTLIWEDRRFGDVGWTTEEFLFLNIAFEFDRFYAETQEFLSRYFEDKQLFNNLLSFQKNIIKLPSTDKLEFKTDFDFKHYFSEILYGRYDKLEKTDCTNIIANPVSYNNWIDYARFVIWYGRKDSRNIYLEEIDVIK